MTKKFWTNVAAGLAAVLLLSTSFASTALAATKISDTLTVTTGTPFSATAAQVVADTLYLVMDHTLVSLSAGQEEPTTVLDLSTYEEINSWDVRLCSDGDELYLFNSSTAVLYQMEGSELTQIVTLDLSKLKEEADDSPEKVWLKDFIVQDGFLYALHTDRAIYLNTLYRFSLESGKGVQVSTAPHTFAQIVPYKDGQILGFDGSQIVAIDPSNGKVLAQIGTPDGYSVSAMAYDAASDSVLFLSDTELILWKNEKPVTVDYLVTGGGLSVQYSAIWNNQYLFLDGSCTELFACNMAAGVSLGDVKPLTLVFEGSDFNQTELLPKFMNLYPETPIVARRISGNVLEKIALDNLTGDTNIDIFVLSNKLDGHEIFKRGYAEPLTSKTLVDDVSTMYPQIHDFLTQDGVLYGYPVHLYSQYWTVHPEHLEEAQLGSVPETIDEYLDMMVQWYEDFYSNRPIHTFSGSQDVVQEWRNATSFLVSQYVYAYASTDEPLSFDTPEFRSALEKLSALSPWKEQDNSSSNRASSDFNQPIFNTNAFSPLILSNSNMKGYAGGVQHILPPTFAGASQPSLQTSFYYFIVNPHSENKEAATAFLEFYSQNMDLECKYRFHPDFNELVESSLSNVQEYTDKIADIQSNIQAIKDEPLPVEASAENEVYIQALENQRQLQIQSQREALEQAEVALAEAEKTHWEYTPEDIADYRKIAYYMNLEHKALVLKIFDADTWATLSQYLQGTSTLDNALKVLDGKVAMIFFEGQ